MFAKDGNPKVREEAKPPGGGGGGGEPGGIPPPGSKQGLDVRPVLRAERFRQRDDRQPGEVIG
jgi:hypothetical protein